jgi:ribose 5-phosphate isomerase A
MTPSDPESRKRAAALAGVDFVKDGMVVGLGTGSTAKHFVMALGEKVKRGLHVRAVCTSHETASLAAGCGIAVIDGIAGQSTSPSTVPIKSTPHLI